MPDYRPRWCSDFFPTPLAGRCVGSHRTAPADSWPWMRPNCAASAGCSTADAGPARLPGVPTPVIASLLAVGLAAVVSMITPATLRWLPVPADEPGLAPFAELDSTRYRWSSFGAALLSGLAVLSFSEPGAWPVWVPYLLGGTLLAMIDLHTMILPLRLNYLTLAAILMGATVAAGLAGNWLILLGSGLSAGALAGLFWLVWRFSGDRFGFGDVRLAGLIGAATGCFGTTFVIWSMVLGTACGAIWAIVVRVRHHADHPFPYGPALLLGPALALPLQWLLQT